MQATIHNEFLTLTVDTHGAEAVSLKNAAGEEMLWQADPAIWKRHAPILFPWTGKLTGGTFTANGKTYKGGQHGFARDMEHTLLRAEGIEEETFGIITKSFEAEKFKNVAKRLEEILSGEQQDIPKLLFLKLQNNLKPYEKEIPRLYDFAEQMIKIAGKLYKLQVFLLTKKDECCYQITIKIKADRIICNE